MVTAALMCFATLSMNCCNVCGGLWASSFMKELLGNMLEMSAARTRVSFGTSTISFS